MATEDFTTGDLTQTDDLRRKRITGTLFEVALIGATLLGILSLLVLFGYIAFDAFQPLTASVQWYLLYFAVLVAPTAAFTLYARQTPAVRTVNTRAFAVGGGAVVASLTTYVVADALSPYDVLIYAAFGSLPPLAVMAYGRLQDENTYAGPAIPVSILVGIVAGWLTYPVIRPPVGILAAWIAYFGFVTLPVAGLLGWIVAARRSTRDGLKVAGAVIVLALAAAVGGILLRIDPSFLVVITSMGVVPIMYVLKRAVDQNPAGRVGVLGPFILVGGILLGAILERVLGIQGLEAYLTPSLLLNSWDGLTASNAGVYPQIVGSIIIVGFMAVLAFPVGIGAAVYLEEYAPQTGWGGRLASLLEVNISNLAGVPSVVYGLLGLALFRNTFGFGTGVVAAASGTLGLLILPIVVVSAQEAIRSVPDSLRRASYGVGGSRWQTLREVVIPEAVPGILTGTILALARAIGETAPLVIIAVATTTYSPPSGLFSSATALPLQIFAASSNAKPEFRHGVVPAAAIVLLSLMLLMNATAIVLRNKYQSEE